MQRKSFRRLWFIPPVLAGLVMLVVLPKMKRPPQRAKAIERAAKVRVIKAPRVPIVPRVVGYGIAEPARNWEAVAEVPGQVAWLSDDLKSGKIVAEGTELLRIDDSSYQLALIQAETQLSALDVKDQATRASLALEDRSQSLLKQEIERSRQLKKQGVISSSELEKVERDLLEGEVILQNLKNTVAMNVAEQKVLSIQKATANLDLQRTRFATPFDVRITDLKVSQAQYAYKGQLLFSADGLDAVEIVVRFPLGQLRPLIGGAQQPDEDVPAVWRIPAALKLDALVRLQTATHKVEWDARVDRVSGVIDLQTQTIGVVVVVDNPHERARPGQRPALFRNTFVEVELRKKPEGKAVVIPASALRGGKVYVMDKEKCLEIRQVKIGFLQGGVAVIADGLEEGEIVVVSDLVPAVTGMLLDPVEDEKVMERLTIEAIGQQEREQ